MDILESFWNFEEKDAKGKLPNTKTAIDNPSKLLKKLLKALV